MSDDILKRAEAYLTDPEADLVHFHRLIHEFIAELEAARAEVERLRRRDHKLRNGIAELADRCLADIARQDYVDDGEEVVLQNCADELNLLLAEESAP